METAKDELIKKIKSILSVNTDLDVFKLVKCAIIKARVDSISVKLNYFDINIVNITTNDWDEKTLELKYFPGSTIEEWDKFLKSLDFEYDDGYGSQILYGTVWLNDGTWLSRGEYDGSEWWELNVCPELPIEFKRADNIENIINK